MVIRLGKRGGMDVQVNLVWSGPPGLRVEARDDGLYVHAHAGLSEAQVRVACDYLGDPGDSVFQAWQSAVGRA